MTLPFPFSDLSATKVRPALAVAAPASPPDLILCQITSQFVADGDAVSLAPTDFVSGGLRQLSNARPNRLFTADTSLIRNKVGALSEERLAVVLRR